MNNELEALKRRMEDAYSASNAADAAYSEATRNYAAAFAESLGVRIGSTVTTTSKRGYGSKCKIVVSRYRVTAIRYRGWGAIPLTLIGETIRKDGSIGERQEISHDWTLEP